MESILQQKCPPSKAVSGLIDCESSQQNKWNRMTCQAMRNARGDLLQFRVGCRQAIISHNLQRAAHDIGASRPLSVICQSKPLQEKV